MLKLKQNHTPRDVKVLTDQLVDAAGTILPASPFMAPVLLSDDASEAQTNLGVSSFGKSLIDDADASTALSTLGVSAFAKTLLDDTSATAARTTLDALSKTDYDNRKQFVRKNLLDNGDFYWWRYANSQTSNNYGSCDRWYNGHRGSSKSVSRQSFAAGQTDVPGSPWRFARTVVTSVAGANNAVWMRQPILGSTTLSGKTATLTFWAKADANRSISTEFVQYFGTTGASPNVTGIAVQKWNLTTSWQKFQMLVNIPSAAGKTISPTDWDSLDLNIWLEAGSNLNARTNSLGQQSGTFDIARISLIEGDATDLADPFFSVPMDEELHRLMFYYQYYNAIRFSAYSTAGATVYADFPLNRAMFQNPTTSFYSSSYSNASSVAIFSVNTNHLTFSFTVTAAGAAWMQTGIELFAHFWGYDY